MVTGASAAGLTDDAVEVLHAIDDLQQLVLAQAGKVGAKAAAQDVAGGLGNLHSQRCRYSDVLATVVRIYSGLEQGLGLEQLDLAADGGLALAERVGDGTLLDTRIPLQDHQDFELAETNTKLLLEDLVGLLADNVGQVLD